MWGIMAPLSLFSNSHLSLSSFPSCFWWLPSQSVKFWNWNPFRLRSFLCAIFIQKKNCVVKMKLFFIFIGKKTFNINCFNLFLLKKRNNLFLRARRSQKKQELRRGNSPYFHKSSEKKKTQHVEQLRQRRLPPLPSRVHQWFTGKVFLNFYDKTNFWGLIRGFQTGNSSRNNNST